jgi:hypothetical protein
MTDRDIIREIAENEPLITAGGFLLVCGHCRVVADAMFERTFPHADKCWYVYCVEKMKEREDESF